MSGVREERHKVFHDEFDAFRHHAEQYLLRAGNVDALVAIGAEILGVLDEQYHSLFWEAAQEEYEKNKAVYSRQGNSSSSSWR